VSDRPLLPSPEGASFAAACISTITHYEDFGYIRAALVYSPFHSRRQNLIPDNWNEDGGHVILEAHMKFDGDLVRQGIEAAFVRTREHFEAEPRRIRELTPGLIRVLEGWPAEAHPRFVTLFAELWAIAEAARVAYGEPGLRDEEIRDFLGHCFAYFNSFKHR
jgi:hypothetical protein